MRYKALVALHDGVRREGINLFQAGVGARLEALPEMKGVADMDPAAVVTSLRAIEVALTQRTERDIELVASVPDKIRLESDVPMTEDTLATMVAGANRDLLVLAFELKSESFRQRLRAFLEPGDRRLRIVVDHRVDASGVRAQVVNWAHEDALEIWQYVRRADLGGLDDTAAGIMHAKVVVADHEDCLVGSANFTDSALNNRNFELGVRFPSKKIAEMLWRTTDHLPSQLFRRIC